MGKYDVTIKEILQKDIITKKQANDIVNAYDSEYDEDTGNVEKLLKTQQIMTILTLCVLVILCVLIIMRT